MNEHSYLKRLFQAYYKENMSSIPLIKSYNQREFAFVPWDIEIMNRHISFKDRSELLNALGNYAPKHMYSSGTLYHQPEVPSMDKKGYIGCDLLIDIDVDHFYTPCKENHDIWFCKDCKKPQNGMPPRKCPKCGNSSIQTLSWICEECLNAAKIEILKLIWDFLIPDFDITEEDINIAFSGHRGYHLKIENEKIRSLSSSERRELVDYLTGDNISFVRLGLDYLDSDLRLLRNNFGWTQKILNKIEKMFNNYPNDVLIEILKNSKYGLKRDNIEYLLNNKENILNAFRNLKKFGEKTWYKFLEGIIDDIGAKIDKPVTIDVHRLIRYPGSLHGKTGFKVQELTINQLNDFNPLDEKKEKLDPVYFARKKDVNIELKVSEPFIPQTKIKGEKFGPYSQDSIINVPLHIGVFLLCREVVKTIS